MSEFCQEYAQNCTSRCCDQAGQCPEITNRSCFYAYAPVNKTVSTTSTEVSPGVIAGISGGVIALLAIIPLILWWRKRQQRLRVADSTDRIERGGIRQKSTVKLDKKMHVEINILPPDSASNETPEHVFLQSPSPQHIIQTSEKPKIKSKKQLFATEDDVQNEIQVQKIEKLQKYEANQPTPIYMSDAPIQIP